MVFSWESSRRDRFQGEGSTRDISAVGAYILTPTTPPVDAPVNVEIMISALFGPIKVKIKGQMRVQRVKHAMAEHEQSGFSVVGEWNELQTADLENENHGDRPARQIRILFARPVMKLEVKKIHPSPEI